MNSKKISFTLNGNKSTLQVDSDSKLIWLIREEIGLMGTKIGCGIGQCGACTVLINGNPAKSCITASVSVENKTVETIENLSKEYVQPLQKAWISKQAPQCGYCQSGQLMQATALLRKNPSPSRDEIIHYMNGVLCRCGTYLRIIEAILLVSEENKTL